ncbi:MAG: ferredoxin [Nanoarchaeota archaeon]|nr:ferredoxin [Nanoarchaeota archaeon]
MPKYKIVHDKEGCIGCGACAANCSANWEMKGGKSSPKKKEITDKELDCNMNAAQGCPVNVIHIKDEKGKQLI